MLSEDEFNITLELAKQYGVRLSKSVPSFERSFIREDAVYLVDRNGATIASYPIRLIDKSCRSDRAKAVAWARSMGYPIPQQPNGCATAIVIAIGFLIFIVPGLMVLIWVAYQQQAYEREMNAIVARWVDAGRPKPGVKTNVENKLAAAELMSSTAEKLSEYNEMLDQGLISKEEHELLRKKELGL